MATLLLRESEPGQQLTAEEAEQRGIRLVSLSELTPAEREELGLQLDGAGETTITRQGYWGTLSDDQRAFLGLPKTRRELI